MKRYQSDRAVRKREEDLLGRVPFADQLADAFVGWREDESLVVSLTGAWGSGKTSIKNFVLDTLTPDAGGRRADVLEFSPWELSGTGAVEEHFFSRIGAFLGRKDAAKQDRAIAKKWARWTAALRIPEAMVEPLTKHLSTMAVALGLATMGVSVATINKLPWIVGGAVVVLLGNLLATSTTIAQRVAEFFAARVEANESGPAALKIELAELLRRRERPLVIVIDDIDRLTSREIRLVFRLIKANADLPRMLYFVLFERDAVIRALEREGFISGERYLEKIVQAPFVVPALQETMLTDVLITRLNEILRQLPDWQPPDESRWIDLFFQRLHVYFATLRDVYRFLAAFEFHAGVFRDGESFEVNIVDLFVLEILRMFEPQIYERLGRSKQVLVHGTSSRFDQNTDASKKVLQEMLEGAQRPDAVRAALSELFPRASWAWGGHHYGAGFDEAWTAAKRVGTDTHFEKYFYFAVPKGDIAQVELDRFVSDSGNRESSRQFLRALKQDGRIERFLLRLEYEKDRIPLDHAVSFVTAMLDEGDDLPRRTDMWGIDAEMHLHRIIYWYLLRLRTVEEREAVLKPAIEATDAAYGPAYLVSFEEPSEDRRPDRQPVISEQTRLDFQQLCAAKIAVAAERGTLLAHPQMVRLLYYWFEWTGGTAVRTWAGTAIQRPASAVAFLRGFVQFVKRQGMGSLVTRNIPMVDLNSLEKFVSLDVLERALGDAMVSDSNDERAIKLFRKALNRRKNGLPDREPLALDEDAE
jgi:predicted KAP-like P-loop ATPase